MFLQNTRSLPGCNVIFFQTVFGNDDHLKQCSSSTLKSRATLDSPSTRIWMVWTYACQWQPNALMERIFQNEKRNVSSKRKKSRRSTACMHLLMRKNIGKIKLSNSACPDWSTVSLAQLLNSNPQCSWVELRFFWSSSNSAFFLMQASNAKFGRSHL